MERYIFVGGSGRSGTSYVAKYLSLHPEVLGIEDVEVKFVGELHGLVELKNALVLSYTLPRAQIAVKNFAKIFNSLYGDTYEKQLPLDFFVSRVEGNKILSEYLLSVTSGSTDYPKICNALHFEKQTRKFFREFYECGAKRLNFDGSIYLEKTPHNLLNMRFISRLFPNSRFVHVNRDPRSVCWSLRNMSWGPDTLSECISWYKCYSSAWIAERARANYDGIEVFEFRIEDLGEKKDEVSNNMTEFLKLRSTVQFDNFNITNLNKWVTHADRHDIDLMNRGLEEEIRAFGYQIDSIGLGDVLEAA